MGRTHWSLMNSLPTNRLPTRATIGHQDSVADVVGVNFVALPESLSAQDTALIQWQPCMTDRSHVCACTALQAVSRMWEDALRELGDERWSDLLRQVRGGGEALSARLHQTRQRQAGEEARLHASCHACSALLG